MKKFYSTAIAALCAFGVSATINVSPLRTDLTEFKSNVKAEKVTTGKPIALKKISSRADGDATANASISGQYLMYLGDYYTDNGLGEFELSAVIQQLGDKIVISCNYFVQPVTAKYEEATGKITFVQEKFGEIQLQGGTTAYYRFEPFSWDTTNNKVISGDYDVYYDAANGVIEFPEDHGFSWAAYKDNRYMLSLGYLRIFDVFDFEDAAHWNYLGNGVFTDNAVGPYITGTTIPPYEVAVLQSTIEPTIYMVTDPWFGTYEELGMNKFSPTIYLDATDKENVLLILQSTGIKEYDKNDKPVGLYLVTNDGYLSEYMLEEPETPQAYTTLTADDTSITFTFNPRSLVLALTSSGNAYGIGDTASTLVVALEGDANSSVSDITVDKNAPVEYFNLQGVRIDNPAAGQVVIKRQGTKVTKTLVR